MATFKVGQRVRITRSAESKFHGMEGTIVAIPGVQDECSVLVDGYDPRPNYIKPTVGFLFRSLEPLTPPQADTWAADKVRELVKPKPMDAEIVREAKEDLREVLRYYAGRSGH